MGINVYENKSVILDHSHQRLVDTSIEGNPTEDIINDIYLKFVFRRRSTPTFSDGNPLVYSLKQMRGYTIQPMYRNMLFNHAKQVLQNMAGTVEGDILVDVPSSKPLCREFLGHASSELHIPKRESEFLRKRTIGEVLSDFDLYLPSLGEQESKIFKSAL